MLQPKSQRQGQPLDQFVTDFEHQVRRSIDVRTDCKVLIIGKPVESFGEVANSQPKPEIKHEILMSHQRKINEREDGECRTQCR